MQRSIWFAIVGMLVIVDHQAKQLATLYLYYGVPRPITSWLNATLLHNKGAAFSFLSSSGGWQIWFFSAVSLVVSIGITLWYWRLPSTARWLATALALVLGGALGNLWDRIALGYVIDFIDVYYGTYHWPAFNIADSAICVGAGMLLWDTFRHPQGNANV